MRCNSLGLMHCSMKREILCSSPMHALSLLRPQRLKTGLFLGGDIEKQRCDEDCAARVTK